jgi:predicted metal-dependent phosphoesterase TrpH
MATFKDIEAIDNGARFVNVDLHIHSYGASADVTDTAMTPKAIVDSALKQGLSVIAITDHNSDVNVAEAVSYAATFSGKIIVIPGVEVTTAHGHLLAYFSPNKIDSL